ncbi:MAG: ribosomal-processing cysteine protease Prp [Bacilli bacterium]|nr:ribosomal-processing cysteine protease Prp [Bacilli bacterium]
MITVIIKKHENSDKIRLIEVKGHADSAPYGKDLVCAAVSAVMTGGFNALQGHDYRFILEDGHALVEDLDECSDYDSVVLKTIETQLQTIYESNKEFITICKD